MWSVPVDLWIGNAAAVVSSCWGAVSRRAHETGYSRTSIYNHAHRVVQAVVNEQAGGVSYEPAYGGRKSTLVQHQNAAAFSAIIADASVRDIVDNEHAAKLSANLANIVLSG